jgi:hypothetical protein
MLRRPIAAALDLHVLQTSLQRREVAVTTAPVGDNIPSGAYGCRALARQALLGLRLFLPLLGKQALANEVGEDDLARQVLPLAAEVSQPAFNLESELAGDRVRLSLRLERNAVGLVHELVGQLLALRLMAAQGLIHRVIDTLLGGHDRKSGGLLLGRLLKAGLLWGWTAAQFVKLPGEKRVLVGEASAVSAQRGMVAGTPARLRLRGTVNVSAVFVAGSVIVVFFPFFTLNRVKRKLVVFLVYRDTLVFRHPVASAQFIIRAAQRGGRQQVRSETHLGYSPFLTG